MVSRIYEQGGTERGYTSRALYSTVPSKQDLPPVCPWSMRRDRPRSAIFTSNLMPQKRPPNLEHELSNSQCLLASILKAVQSVLQDLQQYGRFGPSELLLAVELVGNTDKASPDTGRVETSRNLHQHAPIVGCACSCLGKHYSTTLSSSRPVTSILMHSPGAN